MAEPTVGPLGAGDTFLGKYEIRSLLGKGGHAFVYEAYDPFLDRSVAIKVIKSPKDAGRDLGKRARAEAQVLSRVDHKNLVKVLDAGSYDGLVYLIMEKLVGRTLRDALRDLQRLSVAEAITIGLQVAEGMEVAHREQVVHRDLKPENIFIEAGNALKVLDFGIAKVLGMAGHPDTTQKDLLQGTVLYMSPEHLQGIGVTARSDIYALGTILFEALHAHPLAVGERPAGLQEAAWMQIAKVPPMLDELDASIPRFISRVIHRAIVKIPDQRYQSMREFRDALQVAASRLKSESANHPTQQSLRELSLTTLAAAQQPLPRDTVRAVPVLTSQATVAAPRHDRGDTEPISRLPFTLPPEAAPGQGHAPFPRDDRTPLIYGTVPTATQAAQGRGQPAPSRELAPAPRTHPLFGNQAEHPTHAVVPLSAAAPRADAPPAVTPNTAPPVSSRVAPPPIKLPTPLHEDRGVRVAIVAAVLVGVVGGAALGFHAPPTASQSAVAVASSFSPPPAQPTAPRVAAAPAAPPDEAAPTPHSSASPAPNLEATSQRAEPQPTPSSPAALPRAVAVRAAANADVDSGLGAAPSTAQRSAKPSIPSKPPAPRATAAASELQQRLEWLDREAKPKTSSSKAPPF